MILAIVGAALIGMWLRPWKTQMWVWPAAAALVLMLTGIEPLAAAAQTVASRWNVLLFILGLMGIGAAAEESGVFAWVTEVALARAGGSTRTLFVLLFLVGAVVTLLLSNDATAVMLTPVVYRAVSKRGGDVMPFLFGTKFVADTASFGLPFANPTNVLILPSPHVQAYLWHLGPPQIVAIAINLAIFLWVFRRPLHGTYAFASPEPIDGRAVRTLVAMVLVACAYFAALLRGWPIGVVAAIGAVVTLLVALPSPRAIVAHISWSTFALLFALFTLLDALTREGLMRWALHAVSAASHFGTLGADASAAAAAALLSNAINNLPVAAASAFVVAQAHVEHLAYPLIAGVDVGPNLTPTGSIATILWLNILHERGVHVNRRHYVRLGLLTVPPILLVTIAWLAALG